jgi:hypothetical protein
VNTQDPFDTAQFFSLSAEDESLSHESPTDAIGEHFDYGEEPAAAVTVYAWTYKPLPVFDAIDAEAMIEGYEEHNLEEYLDPNAIDWHIWQGEVRDEFKVKLIALFAEFREKAKPWACEIVAQREYSADDVSVILGKRATECTAKREAMPTAVATADALFEALLFKRVEGEDA